MVNLKNEYTLENLSAVITAIRFPMICLIVLDHVTIPTSMITAYPGLQLSFSEFLCDLFSKSLSGVGVPLFFFISGYLFFRGFHPTFQSYFYKLKGRIRSLFIPYLIYTYIAIFIFAIMQMVLPQMMSGAHEPIAEWSVCDWLRNGLWLYEDEGIPFVGALWFVRNLLVMVVASPIIWWTIHLTKGWIVVALGILWYMDVWQFGIPGTMGLFFFTTGGVMSKLNFLNVFARLHYVWAFFLVMLIIDALTKDFEWNAWLHRITILLGVPLFVNFFSFVVVHRKWHIHALLTEATFFVYAAHTPYIAQFEKIIIKLFPLSSNCIIADMESTILYFFYMIFFVTALVLIYWFIKKVSPCFASILTGGRIVKS